MSASKKLTSLERFDYWGSPENQWFDFASKELDDSELAEILYPLEFGRNRQGVEAKIRQKRTRLKSRKNRDRERLVRELEAVCLGEIVNE